MLKWDKTHHWYTLGSQEPVTRIATCLVKNQRHLFCDQNGAKKKWLLTTCCCIYRSVYYLAIIRETSSCNRWKKERPLDGQHAGQETKEHPVLNGMSPSNLFPGNSRNCWKETEWFLEPARIGDIKKTMPFEHSSIDKDWQDAEELYKSNL